MSESTPNIPPTCISYKDNLTNNVDDSDDADDNELQSIIFEDVADQDNSKKETRTEHIGNKEKNNAEPIIVTDTVTDAENTDLRTSLPCSWLNHDEVVTTENLHEDELQNSYLQENEVLNNFLSPQQILQQKDRIPESVLWSSILSALDSFADFDQLVQMAKDLKDIVPELKPRNHGKFCPLYDTIDKVAQMEIPPDGPVNLKAVFITEDGNCQCRAISKAYYNTYKHHVKIRARIVLEGVLN